jgi:hypothetical protein
LIRSGGLAAPSVSHYDRYVRFIVREGYDLLDADKVRRFNDGNVNP